METLAWYSKGQTGVVPRNWSREPKGATGMQTVPFVLQAQPILYCTVPRVMNGGGRSLPGYAHAGCTPTSMHILEADGPVMYIVPTQMHDRFCVCETG